MYNEIEFEKQVLQQLDKSIAAAEIDSNEVITVVAAYFEASSDRMETALKYQQKVIGICEKWSNGTNLAEGAKCLVLALYEYVTSQFENSDNLAKKAMEIFLTHKHYQPYGAACMVRGANFRSLGEFDKAVKYLLMGEEHLDPNGIFSSYSSYSHYHLAEIYFLMKDYEAAEASYSRAVQYADKGGKIMPVFRSYNGLGNFYLTTGQLEKGFKCIERALEISNTENQKARALCDLGIYYLSVEDYQKAITHLTESLTIRQSLDIEDACATSMMYLSKACLHSGEIEKAKELAQKSLEISQKYQAKSKIVYCYQLLAQIMETLEYWEDALAFYHKYEKLQEELSNQQMQNIYKLKNRLIEDQKTQIEIAHKEITDSIVYAKRIQTAILPPKSQLNKSLNNYFILYKPKDVVAGDFYWLETASDTTFLAAADCTGHGVPGAMVSVVCNNALNRTVREFGIAEPGKILDKARELIIAEFEKSEEEVKDGMDIALVSLSLTTNSSQNENSHSASHTVLKYAGANNPLWLIRKGEVIEYAGNKQPVGKFSASKDFTTHDIQLQPGDTFYIFTDGYADQFGGEKGKKFKTKNLKALLLSIQDKPIDEHQHILDEVFENWKGTLEQIDDICVIGVRMK